MSKFIKVDNQIINVEEIETAKFINDDIYRGSFEDNSGNLVVDWFPFKFAEIKMKSGEVIDVCYDLYAPEEQEDEDEWFHVNLGNIREAWDSIVEELEPKEIETCRKI